MDKITLEEVKKIAKNYGLKPIRVKGTEIVNIRKNPSDKIEEISWEEFDKALKKRGLAVYKATESDFLKIMKA
jgi:sugar phosphate isomerase/epimerase